jgi:OOP family OmpA-OmpF porin
MKKTLIGLSLAVATLFASNQYEVGLGMGRHGVSSSPIENYNFLNLRIGKYLKKNHIVRFELERSEKILNNNERLTRALLNVEHYFPLEKCKITPYAYVGLGYQWVSGNYDDNVVADLGLGAKYPINEKLNTFLEMRGLRDFGNNDNHYGFILGLTYKFGNEKTAVAKPVTVEPVKPKDSDNDGIIDELDKCPNTPQGVKVDKNGCQIDSDGDGVYDNVDKCPNTPRGVKVDINGCPIDSDKDGVPDYLDKCPDTMQNIDVNKNGCALDRDNDGVADYLDKCPNTPSDIKVNKVGCPVIFNFNVRFDYNSAHIKPESMDRIREFAEFLRSNPIYKAEIQGYTDSKGSALYNQKLSERRAKAVYEALIKLGVSKDRLSYKGYGEANPIASNDTESGKAKNRRVVAKLYY